MKMDLAVKGRPDRRSKSGPGKRSWVKENAVLFKRRSKRLGQSIEVERSAET